MARIDHNEAAYEALLKSPGVQADLRRRGARIAARAGSGMEVESSVGANRARVSVRTATPAARRAEAEDRALTRAIDAGRG